MAAIQQLRDYLAANPSVKESFQQSLDLARSFNVPQLNTFGPNDGPIMTVENLIWYFENFLTWTPSENFPGNNVYNHICVFYLVLDQPPVSTLQTPIDPSSTPPWTWLSNWLIVYSLEMGSFMNTPASLTPESLRTFYDSPAYGMDQYDPYPGPWKTFNEFFARHIAPRLRPVDPSSNPADHTIIVSPADSTFDGSWTIDEDAHVDFTNPVVSKGLSWSITELLKDTPYGPFFAGGKFAHSFLGPTDYHRQHAPVAGEVLDAKMIHGQCYLEVVVVDDEKRAGGGRLDMRRKWGRRAGVGDSGRRIVPLDGRKRDHPDAPDSPGYQFLQSRALVVIKSLELGLVAVLPMGMAQISSVVLSVKKGDVVQKGDEISCFQFGGSDIVLVFQKDANVDFTAATGTHYNYGKQIATASPAFPA